MKILIKYTIAFCLSFGTFCAYNPIYAQEETNLEDRSEYIDGIIELFKNNKWEEGKRVIDEGLNEYSNDSDLRMLNGKYYHYKGQNDKARFELVKSLQIDPKNVDAKQILVNVELETKRYSSAICYVNELLEVNPYWKGLWRKKIQLYRLQNNHVEADRLQERVNQIYPKDEEIRKDYLYSLELEARKKRKEGDINGAIKVRKKLLQENPDQVENYTIISDNYIKSGDLYTALGYIDRGLSRFPNNKDLIDKKSGILAEQNRYTELLPFLKSKGKTQQYDYYLLEAARYSKNQEAQILYGKVFEDNPGNDEAFENLYNYLIAANQYNEALRIIKIHRQSTGNSKNLLMREIMTYELIGNDTRSAALTKRLYESYPNDYDVQSAYALIMLEEAKDKMSQQLYAEAIKDWYIVLDKSNDSELEYQARKSIFNSYYQMNQYTEALNVLNELIAERPEDNDLFLKRADLYYNQKKYDQAILAYNKLLEKAKGKERQKYLYGYSALNTKVVQDLVSQYHYDQALRITESWIENDTTQEFAYRYAINLSYQTNNPDKAKFYAEEGNKKFPNNLFFKIKLAEISAKNPENYSVVYYNLSNELNEHPYDRDLINAHAQATEDYGHQLIRGNKSPEAIRILKEAVRRSPENIVLKHTLGQAYEKIKNYDSAYYYQSFYVPSAMEMHEFKQYMNYLYNRTLDNEIGVHHIRSRPGDIDVINPISGIHYTRYKDKNTYTGRVNYAGRPPGKGYQLMGIWNREWNSKTRTTIDAAIANQFFPRISINGLLSRDIQKFKEFSAEIGLGYRYLDTTGSSANLDDRAMYNLLLGAKKVIDEFSLYAKYNSFILDYNYLFNFSLSARYSIWSPKHYLTAVTGFGSSPAIQLLDYQIYDGISSINTMVGGGFSYMFTKNITFSLLGTWHNYRTDDGTFRNHHNLFLNVNVAF
ncbi:tetratricopeptide repeat protein [Brumimicrobium aurantiacum]|uniref:YaiO family outer membrane beta-barrel protein n=1 Tax=Brumimicrobium aurantiacum TaxID=1737063 RepID=A0A3E1EXQ7_9FLAO|nr:tetratricopeptide repeat protein [Brumimicrobium aurantiacum]RFC54339.1 hypothetical protein DXU93_07890 [Brumimicrobium aurantiacum]